VDGVRKDGLRKELRKGLPISDRTEALVENLDKAFSALLEAQTAIVNLKTLDDDLVLTLFNRIGAGGIPLTGEDMLFSIYKFYEPKISDIVNALYNDPTVGRALSPTKIAAAAIRIANALSHRNDPAAGNWLPSVETFSKEMSKQGESNIRTALRQLLGGATETKFTAALTSLFQTLALLSIPDDIGFPRVMMVTLSPRLLEVLLMWVITELEINPLRMKAERANIVRFVMFWRLSVFNEDKASNLCFTIIKSEKIKSANRPLLLVDLFNAILEADEQIAIPLVHPNQMKDLLCSEKPSHGWRTYNERFPAEPNPHSVIARLWWNSGKSTLIWLQRAYLQSRFPDFDPASGRDDDTPYDADHMVPYSDWGRNWARLCWPGVLELSGEQRDAIRHPRFLLGNSIGNLRLIDFAVNRAEHDDPFMTKLKKEMTSETEGQVGEMSAEDQTAYHSSMGFDPNAIELWGRASGGEDRVWPIGRLEAFQEAVEKRAAWLYDLFYSDLGFASWDVRVVNDGPLMH
jgi:hypothetical protein